MSARLPAALKSSREASAASVTAGAGVGFGCSRINVVRIEADLIVDFSLLRIAEHFVRLGERLELLFRSLVSRIYVGMVLARQLAESFADVVC